MSSPPRVRIGIVTWNASSYIGACLDALPAAMDDLAYDVVVVDNASVDATGAIVAEYTVRLIESTANVGYARAMNRALNAAAVSEPAVSEPALSEPALSDAASLDDQCDVLIALNPDTVPAPGTLAALVARVRSDDTIGVASPRLSGRDGVPQAHAHRFPSIGWALAVHFVPGALASRGFANRWWFERSAVANGETVENVDWTVGAVHVLRAAALGDPVYSERTFMYGEDLDLCWRVGRAGRRVVRDGTVTVLHVGNVAGADAFGATRDAAQAQAQLHWLASVHNAAYARTFALVTLAGLGIKATVAVVARTLGPRRLRLRCDAIVAEIHMLMPTYWRALFGAVGLPTELTPRGASFPLPSDPTPR